METSDSEPMKKLGGFPKMRRYLAAYFERKRWEEENPELAAAWTQAMLEDAHRDEMREAGRLADQVGQDAPGALGRLGVPKHVVRAVRSPTGTPALAAAKEWWLAGKSMLLLLGGVGSGKTTAAAWVMLKHLQRDAVTPRPSGGVLRDVAMFATAPEFNGLSDYNAESRAWMDRLSRCGLLVLDDLGTERMGDGEMSCVQRLVSERHASGRLTVLTSNLTAEAFRARYGERVADRIREAGMVKACGKESLRRPA